MLRITGQTPGRQIASRKPTEQRQSSKAKPHGKGTARPGGKRTSKRSKPHDRSSLEATQRETAIQIALQKATELARAKQPVKKKKPKPVLIVEQNPTQDASAPTESLATSPAQAKPKPPVKSKAPPPTPKKKRKKTKSGNTTPPHPKVRAAPLTREERNGQLRQSIRDQMPKLPAGDRWGPRRDEILAFQDNIQAASFDALLKQWKRHVGLTAYIEKTGHNRERLADYQKLLAAIEKEWKRRNRLTYSAEEYFDWPTTKAGFGRGKVGEIDWASEGALAYLGYHVGERSELREIDRHALLRRFFRMTLPPIESPDYVASWGKPESAARLKRMADSLASFVRSAKRRKSINMSTAVAEWECDLTMLYNEFYVAKFGFGWPVT